MLVKTALRKSKELQKALKKFEVLRSASKLCHDFTLGSFDALKENLIDLEDSLKSLDTKKHKNLSPHPTAEEKPKKEN